MTLEKLLSRAHCLKKYIVQGSGSLARDLPNSRSQLPADQGPAAIS